MSLGVIDKLAQTFTHKILWTSPPCISIEKVCGVTLQLSTSKDSEFGEVCGSPISAQLCPEINPIACDPAR